MKPTFFSFVLLWTVGCLCGCQQQEETTGTPQTQAVAMGYRAAAGEVLNSNYEQIPFGTTFRFIASVVTNPPLPTPEPSLNGSGDIDPAWASPYGTYCFKEDPQRPINPIWEPCEIDGSYNYVKFSTVAGQRLTVENDTKGVSYFITAFYPPLGTVKQKAATVIPYKRDQKLSMCEKVFTISIAARPYDDYNTTTPAETYKIYPLPENFTFVEMRSKLTIGIYQEEVPFTLVGADNNEASHITVTGLGVYGQIQPFTRVMRVLYQDNPHPDDENLDIRDHFEDHLPLKPAAPSGEARKLRYSLDPIYIFPVDYSGDASVPITVLLNIEYGNGDISELPVRIPINAQPSINYLINLVIARSSVRVIAAPTPWNSSDIPDTPIEVGGAGGGVLLGEWDLQGGWKPGMGDGTTEL